MTESPWQVELTRSALRDRFDSIEHARAFCRPFFDWYNGEHRHSGIGLLTPSTVHHGHAQTAYDARADVLNTAYAATPERFINQRPVPPELPTAAWINKPDSQETEHKFDDTLSHSA